ncbi:hypothetical protein TMatcc_002275 [Talaromyces marneffei ATCC 18224]|uniref:uncharacterized protein n=1 Tax=Talaromyces marneffei TaxID=37727 RepID=UPI0012A8AB2F|nr:uncharacterized protein EYB26_006561 [Talaromyces marneffei]QGA18876.1 hypothetical protein EYB26_006561 [Talaromyces marneffei]
MSVPIPTILDWSNEPSNSIGSEYIIMEHVEGVQLHKKWPEMAGDERVRCINAIYRKLKEIVDLQFPAFGSVNFEANLQSGCKGISLGGGFCVGLHCGSRYWDCNISEPRYYHNTQSNRGLWTTLDQYCDGLVDAGLSRIPPKDYLAEKRPSYHGSVQAHLDILQRCRSVLKEMCKDPRIQAAATLHPDLHKRNIFVSETDSSKITGIIDWQWTSIEPAFWYADDVPDFAVTDDSDNNLCAKAFGACTRFLTPKLSGPRLMDDNLFRPFLYSYRTWKDGAVALRHEPIETTRKWNELGFVGQNKDPRNEEPVKDEAVLRSIWPFDLSSLDTSSLIGSIAKQTLIGHDTLHKHNICHGDLHTRNLVFAMSCLDDFVESDLIKGLGQPETGYIRRRDGKVPEPGVPENVMRLNVYQP